MSSPKSCMVCGDKALGYNFNAVTCESCKAFFRRNALAKKKLNCAFNQNCEITTVTRRFCQSCRLKKCIDIGMKSENIMSEEDKILKWHKIASNRAKRKTKNCKSGCFKQMKLEQIAVADGCGTVSNEIYDSQSCASSDSLNHSDRFCLNNSIASASLRENTPVTPAEVNSSSMSTADIVEFIVCDPDKAAQSIKILMRTPAESLMILERIINSPSHALRLISHLISYPGNALKIISIIMNSPFDALTVFTKFMSSPMDAIEIISKIVSSPQDVLTFVKQLMNSPENALDIMNKFMNTPAEALKIINQMVSRYQSRAVTLESLTPQFIPGDDDAFKINGILYKSSSTGKSNPVLFSTPSVLKDPATSPYIAVSPYPNIQNNLLSTSHDTDINPSQFMPVNGFNAKLDNRFKSREDVSYNHCFIGNGSDSSLDSVLTKVISIEYETHSAIQESCMKQELFRQEHNCVPLTDQIQSVCAPSSLIGRDLNETEKSKLRELKIANEALYYPVDEDLNDLIINDVCVKSEGTHQDPKLLQVINLTAVAIKRLIKMAKKITAFRDLCQEDQVAVLKGGCIEMMLMRSVMTYDDNRNAWKIPHTNEGMSNIRADVLKLAKGNVYEEHLRFIRTFDEKWRMDENIILILCAIILLSPNRPRIIHSDVIKLEQNSYYYLLRRYLESIYPGCEAKSAFIKLVQKISDIERLNQFMIGVYLNVNPSQVEPLLREIFDMKNH